MILLCVDLLHRGKFLSDSTNLFSSNDYQENDKYFKDK